MIAGGISPSTVARLQLVTPLATLDEQTKRARERWEREHPGTVRGRLYRRVADSLRAALARVKEIE